MIPVQQPERADGGAYAWSIALVVGSTGVALLGRSALHLPDVVMLYLLAILVASFRFGRGPSIAASALSVATYDFFFVPPFYTLSVEHARHVLTFAMMFGLGLVVSNLASRLRTQEAEARLREEHTAALYALSRELVAVPDAASAAAIAARHAAAVFGGEASVLLSDRSGELAHPGPGEPGGARGEADRFAQRWANEHGRPAGAGTEIFPHAGVGCVPLSVGLVPLGVLVLHHPAPGVMDSANRDFLEVFARQAAFAIERVRLAEEAKAASLRARSEEMRSSLLSAVSHDLRSPLAAITGAGTTLRDEGDRLGPGQRADLVDAICIEAERMERLVANILDMVRLEGGAMTLKRDWVPLEEVLGSALGRLDAKLQGREVTTDLPADLPLVPVDPVLFEQVFVNLLDNAVKYTAAGSPVAVAARAVAGALEIVVADRGPGIPPGDEGRLFEKFHRGAHAGGGGVGLGLAICRGIVEAHGGTIAAANREGGGAEFRIRLPLVETPPAVLAEPAGEGGA
jgi:two-component system sensor histidine kinase KdpD